MSSDAVFKAIEEIAATSSTNAKLELIKKGLELGDFELIVYMALNPFITYGIAQVPEVEPYSPLGEFDEMTFDMLSLMSRRELTGSSARDALVEELGGLTKKSGELLKRVLTKDLRAGFGATLCNKAKKGWIPVFDCMLAHPFDPKRVKGYPVAVEPKLDGFRLLAFVDTRDKGVKLYTRNGQEFTSVDHLKPELLRLALKLQPELDPEENLVVFDGEAVSGTFNQTASGLRKKGVQCSDAIYHVFEVLPGHVFTTGTTSGTYIERRRYVQELPDDGLVRRLPSNRALNQDQVHMWYERYRNLGFEGIIVKPLDGRYELKRSYAWLKIKAEETLDLEVVDVFEGTGKYAGKLGGVTVLHSGVRVNVGSGFTDLLRDELWGNSDVIGRVIEVQYHEITPDGSLRHPRFVRFRDDKRVERAA